MAAIHVHKNGDIAAARDTLARAPRSSNLHAGWLRIAVLQRDYQAVLSPARQMPATRLDFSGSRRSDTAPDSRGIQRPWTR